MKKILINMIILENECRSLKIFFGDKETKGEKIPMIRKTVNKFFKRLCFYHGVTVENEITLTSYCSSAFNCI